MSDKRSNAAHLDLNELATAAKGLVYISDGTRASERLGRIVDAFPALLAAAHQAERQRAALADIRSSAFSAAYAPDVIANIRRTLERLDG